jgi:hypothetical protein
MQKLREIAVMETAIPTQLNMYQSYALPQKVIKKLIKQDSDQQQMYTGGLGFFKLDANQITFQDKMTENNAIKKYREWAETVEACDAITEIRNEVVPTYEAFGDEFIKLVVPEFDENKHKALSKEVYELLGERFIESFERIKTIMSFEDTADMHFERWYVDGKGMYVYFTKKVEGEEDKSEISDIYWLDPLKIKKVIIKNKLKYYVYEVINIDEFEASTLKYRKSKEILIPADRIIYIPSGLVGMNGLNIGYLNRAIRPLSALKMLENTLIIARLVRAPERFVFQIDTGDLPEPKAMAKLREFSNNYKNKFSVDNLTGEIYAEANSMAITENFWFSKGLNQNHSVNTIGGSSFLANLDDIMLIYKKVYKSLGVPMSRFEENSVSLFGRNDSQITRDEMRFMTECKRKRNRFFIPLFKQAMSFDLLFRKVGSQKEIETFTSYIKFDFSNDSIYERMRESQKFQSIMGKYDQAKGIVNDGYEDIYWFYALVFNYTKEEADEAIKRCKANKSKVPKPIIDNFGGGFGDNMGDDKFGNKFGDKGDADKGGGDEDFDELDKEDEEQD